MSSATKEDAERLREIANSIIKKAGLSNNEYFCSTMAILMVISIVLSAIRILQECNKNRTKDMDIKEKCVVYGEEIKDFSSKRGWFTKLRIKRLLKREMKKEEYEQYGLKLLESILDIGESLRDDQIKTLVENANV